MDQQLPPVGSRFLNTSSTPVMNAIKEEDSPSTGEKEFHTPLVQSKEFGNEEIGRSNGIPTSQTRPFFASPSLSRPNSAFYSSKDGNNSSSSLIYNPAFTFGDAATADQKKQSLKYVPGPQLAPPTSRARSPIRSSSPDSRRRGSMNLDMPFNFTASTSTPSSHTPPLSASRASFRKGHRYKHSSVSMNFFQEPDVKIPLNIAKSLPIPHFRDLINNLPFPRAYFQLFVAFLQFVICIIIFQLGHSKSWNNFITLSHFITYDIIGSLTIILVENLSQFEVWSTGTITFPFGLNRMDVLFSFALAVSLCFVGLDLVFHIIEEFIVLFVESGNNDDNHDEIAYQIPHPHHLESSFNLEDGNLILWYAALTINLLFSALSLFKTFYANKNSKLKTKNPIITIAYTFYLFLYPSLLNYLSVVSDYLAAVIIAVFIFVHGITIAEWTSTILLMGFSTTTLPTSTLLNNPAIERTDGVLSDKQLATRAMSLGALPAATNSEEPFIIKKIASLFFPLSGLRKKLSTDEPAILKSRMKEDIEQLSEFVSRCSLSYDNLLVAKVNFNLYIVLIKVILQGGSNDDELNLRLAIDKCIKRILPSAETTIDIDRI